MIKNNLCSSVFIAATVILTGCNQAILPDMASTGSVFGATQAPAFQHALTQKRPVQEAFLQLPPVAGQVMDVTQSHHGNGVEQLIIYKGDYSTRGENAARVRMVTSDYRPGRRTESLNIPPTSARQISAELKRSLPGVSMRISNRLHTNAYGPFGYALGRASGNVSCLYGWQNMKGTANDRWALIRGASKKPQLSIRLRICRENTSGEQLVELMRNLRVEADPAQAMRPTAVSWNSGVGSDLTTAMPDYEPGGYVSDQLDAVAEQPIVSTPAPAKRVRKKRSVQRVAATTSRLVQKQVRRNTTVYSPPLSAAETMADPVNATLVLVPKPSGTKTLQLSSQLAKPTIPVAVSYAPHVPKKRKKTGKYALVPLPN